MNFIWVQQAGCVLLNQTTETVKKQEQKIKELQKEVESNFKGNSKKGGREISTYVNSTERTRQWSVVTLYSVQTYR